MSRRCSPTTRWSSLSLLWILLAACTRSEGPDPEEEFRSFSITNEGLASHSSALAGEGNLWLFAAREFETGGRDLNLDGDSFDLVAFVQDLASGDVRNTSLALDASHTPLRVQVSGSLALFAVSEQSSGRRDMNGDGDANDVVLHVHDAQTKTTRSLGLALSTAAGAEPAVGNGFAAFAVSEAAQGQADLDGDGRTDGNVLHVYNAANGALENTLLQVSTRISIHRGRLAFHALESDGDLNGDGDELDFVLQGYDLRRQTTSNVGLATDGAAPLFAADTWLVAVPEAAQGARDLNGDGDRDDLVLHAFDPDTELTRNLQLTCPDPTCAVVLRGPAGPELFALLAPEAFGSGLADDWNGDGDFLDRVLFLYDPSADQLRNTGLAGFLPAVLAGEHVAFLVFEFAQGLDLDDDGDLGDAVVTLIACATGQAENLGLDAVDLRGSDDLLLLARFEGSANVDWNLDGDRADVVVHLVDPVTRKTTNTRVASVDVFGVSPRDVLLYASESADSRDHNLDGDRGDEVFVVFERESETITSVGLAGGSDEARFATLTRHGRLAFLVSEAAEARDLDGDGDLFDAVWHRAE